MSGKQYTTLSTTDEASAYADLLSTIRGQTKGEAVEQALKDSIIDELEGIGGDDVDDLAVDFTGLLTEMNQIVELMDTEESVGADDESPELDTND